MLQNLASKTSKSDNSKPKSLEFFLAACVAIQFVVIITHLIMTGFDDSNINIQNYAHFDVGVTVGLSAAIILTYICGWVPQTATTTNKDK